MSVHKWMVTKNAKHCFKTGEVGTTSWDNERGVEKLAVELLDIVKGVSGTTQPFNDGRQILGLLFVREGDRESCKIPLEANEQGRASEGKIFGFFPGDAKLIREGVNVVKVVGIGLILKG